jgi:SAM-dependent methyltransferase
MSVPLVPGVPRPLPVETALAVRRLITGAGYTEAGLEERYGQIKPPPPQLRITPRILFQTAAADPLSLLARCFLLGRPVEADRVRAALPAWWVEACLGCGLFEAVGDRLVPASVLAPCGELLIASDTYEQLGSAGGVDHVLGVGPSARSMIHFMVPRRVESTLDLGAGSGVLGLTAASRSREVVLADLNPRASAYAAFNAALNGLEGVECLSGDTFEPVRGRTFDWIICNPPFVVLTPSREFTYRDSNMPLDRFCERLVRTAPGYLNPGGLLQMSLEWVSVGGEDWQDRVRGWLEGSGCDAWLLKLSTASPLQYAQARLFERLPAAEEDDLATFSRWMGYYRDYGVEAIHGGRLVMRKRAGSNWVRLEEVDGELSLPFGQAIEAGLAARDFLERHPTDGSLREVRLALDDDAHRLQRERREGGRWAAASVTLGQGHGLQRHMTMAPEVAALLGRFDGVRTVGELLDDLAAEVETSPDRIDEEVLRVVRRMVDLGFLLPR